MSEMYNSSSEEYSVYMTNKQANDIKKQIVSSNDTVRSATVVSAAYIKSDLKKYATGINTSINRNTYAIIASANMLQNTFAEGFDSINNTLDLGFAGVNLTLGCMSTSMVAGFSHINSSIERWGASIYNKLDEIHEIVKNPLLTACRELYCRAEKNAANQFFDEALSDVNEALTKNPTDYFSWGLMGRLYLFGISDFSNVINVQEAYTAFQNACKYVSPDVTSSDVAQKLASEFWYYYGYTNYILANESRLANNEGNVKKYLLDSRKAFQKSYNLSSTMIDSKYYDAKCMLQMGEKEQSLSLIKEIITDDALYSIKLLGDSDFESIYADIERIVTEYRDELYKNTCSMVEDIENTFEFVGGKTAEAAKEVLKNAKAINQNTPYLDLLQISEPVKPLFKKLFENDIPYEIEACNQTVECEAYSIGVSPDHDIFSVSPKITDNCIETASHAWLFDYRKDHFFNFYFCILSTKYGSISLELQKRHSLTTPEKKEYINLQEVCESSPFMMQWSLDENTIIQADQYKETEPPHERCSCRFRAFQRGIVKKEYLLAYNKRNSELLDRNRIEVERERQILENVKEEQKQNEKIEKIKDNKWLIIGAIVIVILCIKGCIG